MNKYIVGMDIGGTFIRTAIMRENELLTSVRKREFKHYKKATLEVLDNICFPILELVRELKIRMRDIEVVVLSLSALFNRKTGHITVWPNHRSWDGFPIKEYVEEHLKIPVILEDDANAAALGEHILGAGKSYRDFAYITVSTGIGCGLILDNKLYRGGNGWAGELGHAKVSSSNQKCHCGATGCLQSLASGKALYEKFKENVKPYHKRYKMITHLGHVASIARLGDRMAMGLFEKSAYYIAGAIINIVLLLGVPLVVIGGGVMNAEDIILKMICDHVNEHLRYLNKTVEIKVAELGDNNGVIGALSIGKAYLNKEEAQ